MNISVLLKLLITIIKYTQPNKIHFFFDRKFNKKVPKF